MPTLHCYAQVILFLRDGQVAPAGFNRALEQYIKLGNSENWISQRLKTTPSSSQ